MSNNLLGSCFGFSPGFFDTFLKSNVQYVAAIEKIIQLQVYTMRTLCNITMAHQKELTDAFTTINKKYSEELSSIASMPALKPDTEEESVAEEV